MAVFFNNLIKIVPGLSSTEYSTDLEPTSRMLESLNHRLPQLARNVELRTYFETAKSKISSWPVASSDFIVHKHQALLHMTNEVADSLEGDHRAICKFDSVCDPNYSKIRNALLSTSDRLTSMLRRPSQQQSTGSMKALKTFLDIQDSSQDDLMDQDDKCLLPDSCSWFMLEEQYSQWSNVSPDDATNNDPSKAVRVLLVEADPGAGKSVLCSQIIKDLRHAKVQHSFYFFNSQAKSSLSGCLRSLAFQMALSNATFAEALLEMHDEEPQLPDDDRLLGHKLLTECLLGQEIDRPHFWVIDALDECSNASILLGLLARMTSVFPLRILLTSRPMKESKDDIVVTSSHFSHFHMTRDHTTSSMRAYVEARALKVPLGRRTRSLDRNALVEAILELSDGCFLWVKLVMDRMTSAVLQKSIADMLDEVPVGMDNLYANIFQQLEDNVPIEFREHLQAAFEWTVCCNPSLTTEQLESALDQQFDGEVLIEQLTDLSRNLLTIDKSSRVHMIHRTARQYIMNEATESTFAVRSGDAHARIANILLTRLESEMRTPVQNAAMLTRQQRKAQPIDEYAIYNFSNHVRRANTDSPELFVNVVNFTTNCGLTWLTHVAATGSLKIMVQTSQNLRRWLQSRAKSTPPIGPLAARTRLLEQWTTDLVRLVAKYGKHIRLSPFATYALLPDLVPRESIIARHRSPKSRSNVQQIGLTKEKWDDRLCSIYYQRTVSTTVASCGTTFAVGCWNGDVIVYDSTTLQESNTFASGLGPVKLLKFGSDGKILFCSGLRKILLWSMTAHKELWSDRTKEPYLDIEFLKDEPHLIAITKVDTIYVRRVADGKVVEASRRANDDDSDSRTFRPELVHAKYYSGCDMLASIQRSRPVALTDLRGTELLGTLCEEADNYVAEELANLPAVAMAFSTNPEIPILAVAYRDGAIAVYDRESQRMVKRIEDPNATSLASSPDGRILAVGDVQGLITLYDFETLSPLHTIMSRSSQSSRSHDHINALAFDGEGKRLIDIRPAQCNVWEPPAITNHLTHDADSVSESTLAATHTTSDFQKFETEPVEVTAMQIVPATDFVLCGFNDGSIVAYSTKDGQQHRDLCRHGTHQWIDAITWCSGLRMLVALAGTTSIMISKVTPEWTIADPPILFDLEQPARQLVVGQSGLDCHLMVVCDTRTFFWTSSQPKEVIPKGFVMAHAAVGFDSTFVSGRLGLPFAVILQPRSLLCVDWRDGTQISEAQMSSELPLSPTDGKKSAKQSMVEGTRAIVFGARGSRLLLQRPSTDQAVALELSVLDMRFPSTPDCAFEVTNCQQLPVSGIVDHVIGIQGQREELVFLDKNAWICTVSLRGSQLAKTSRYTRHMFIPDEWISRSSYGHTARISLAGPTHDQIVLVREDKFAVIKTPFKAFSETVSI